MAQSAVKSEYSNFSKGLITEVSPFNDSQNSFKSGENFDLAVDGSAFRRLGMDYEAGFALNTAGSTNWQHSIVTTAPVSAYTWKRVRDYPDKKFICVQIGAFIYFYDATNTAPSSDYVGSTTLDGDGDGLYLFAEINGYLIISNERSFIGIVSYDGTNFNVESKYIEVRDVWGAPIYNYTGKDWIDWNNHPTSTTDFTAPGGISGNAEYNLRNQGWGNVRTTTSNNEDSIAYYFTQRGEYPSNADVWWHYKNDSNQLDGTAGGPVDQTVVPNSRAPMGRFIISLTNRETTGALASRRFPASAGSEPPKKDRHTVATPGISNTISLDYSGKHTAIATFANRVWYGFQEDTQQVLTDVSPDMGSTIAFSRIVKTKEDINRCYSDNDPTSEINAQPLSSDGGTFEVPGMNGCVALVALQDYLIVFGTNGIWAITGGSDGFTATNYILFKISNVGIAARESVIEAEGAVYYWGTPGIYSIIVDPQQGGLRSDNISLTTIQSEIDSIPNTAKAYVRGTYDSVSKKIMWLYNSNSAYDGINLRFKYDTELTLDLRNPRFIKRSIKSLSSRSPFIAGIISLPEFTFTNSNVVVTDSGGTLVVDGSGNNVTVVGSFPTAATTSTKYVTLYPPADTSTTNPYAVTFSLYNNESFLDWESSDGTGVDSAAFMLLDHNTADIPTGGNSFDYGFADKKRGAWIVMHLRRTETGFTGTNSLTPINASSCLVRPLWDFADTTAADSLWGTQIQMYKLHRVYSPTSSADTFNYGQSVVSSKDKLRGRGRALQLRIDTEAGKNCHIYAWTVKQYRDT